MIQKFYCILSGFLLCYAQQAIAQTPVMVKDIYPGIGDAEPTHLVDVNGTLFF